MLVSQPFRRKGAVGWIDQGRQEHGWFGHGTAPGAVSSEFRARGFAVVHFAADDFADRDDLPFSIERTTRVLRSFASVMASQAGLAPNAFRLRFFRDSFDPVDCWAIQLVMRDIAGADTHAGLVQSGRALAATIRAHGRDGWARLLDTAVAHLAPAPPAKAADGDATVLKAQLVLPAGPLPLPSPPEVIPGTPEREKLVDGAVKEMRKFGSAVGSAIGSVFESRRPRVFGNEDGDDEDEEKYRRPRPPSDRRQPPEPAEAASQEGETRDKPPPGSIPIDKMPWSGDHTPIKNGIGAIATDDVRISPNQEVWLKNPDGTWTNHGDAKSYTESGEASGRKGSDRDKRRGS